VGFDQTPEIRAAQVKLLFDQTTAAVTATVINAAILTGAMWGGVPNAILTAWLIITVAVSAARCVLHRMYKKRPVLQADPVRWGRLYILGAALNGLLWGSAGYFFFSETGYLTQIFIAFVLSGMVSGGVSTLSCVPGAYLAFLFPTLLPYAVRLLTVGTDLHRAMGVMVVLYLVTMWLVSRRVCETVAESLRLRVQNLDLLNTLERRVRERTEKLGRSEEALRDADRRKDEFLAVLGHELRNPLAPIRTAVHLMQMPGASDAMMRWGREIIDRQIDHLTRLVDDLLDVSRIVQGKISLHENSVEIGVVIDHAVEASRPLISGRQHQLSVSVPDNPVWVTGDFVRLAQIVSNLLNNAAKYTDIGGTISLTAGATESWVTIRVQDSGIGIGEKMLPHVFDLFTQADHTLARTQGGLGIGLTLVKRLVEMHGGRAEAHSEGAGLGSEFIVHLPRRPAPLSPTRGNGASAAQGLFKTAIRVLVVDDNQDAAESLALLMRCEGHTVLIAYDGGTALAQLSQFRPHAVLLDIGMPGMDGFEVVREMRAREATRTAVIVAVTGYGQPDDRARARAAGFTDHVTKPIDPVKLLSVLNTHLHPV
jgi:signal transduction histidine kinase/CheY-like chemotaxis protein